MSVTETFNATATWVALSDTVDVVCYGAGGGGGGGGSSKGGGGGAGGHYAAKTVTGLTVGNSYTVTVGVGGAAQSGLAGGDSWFVDATTVIAKGGGAANAGSGVGGVPPNISLSIGTTKFSGGAGGASTAKKRGGSGGGSSAGTAANGNVGGNGGTLLSGAGGSAPTGGFAGGHGGDDPTNANITAAGTIGAGGGGKCATTGSSTAGSNGQVTLTYTPTAPVASFTGTPLTGTTPLSVVFTDASTNTPTSWSWEKTSVVGGASGWVPFAGTPTAQNPTESLTAGTWSIRLTATNAGGSNTSTRTDYVVVSAASGHTNRLLMGVG